MRPLTMLFSAGAVTAALISAPAAVASPSCTQTGPTTRQCETNGSAQIVTSPPLNSGPWNPYGGGFTFGFGGFGLG